MDTTMDSAALRSAVIVNDHAFVNGGQAKIAVESALGLKRKGLDVAFVAGVGPADVRLEKAGIECAVVGIHDILSDPNRIRAARRGLWNSKAARVLADMIDSRDADATVVHVHGWSKALSPSISSVVTQSKAAHIYTLHEYFLACPNGGFYDYQADKICTKKALSLQCLTTRCDPRNSGHKAWRVARQAVLRTIGQMPRGLREVIYLSPRQLAIVGPYLPVDARWHHLPNPVEPGLGERVPAERNDAYLFVGRLSPEKGAEIAARAARIAGIRIAFAGDGESRDAVVRANPDAEMLGWLDSDRLGNWMRRARCLVFPSLWYETYGLVVAEALRRGIPVLVSDSSVAAEFITHGVNGFRVEAGNVHEWAACMSQLRDDAIVRNFSLGAFSTGGEFSGHEEYTERLIEIYNCVVAGRAEQTGIQGSSMSNNISRGGDGALETARGGE